MLYCTSSHIQSLFDLVTDLSHLKTLCVFLFTTILMFCFYNICISNCKYNICWQCQIKHGEAVEHMCLNGEIATEFRIKDHRSSGNER